MEVGGDHGADMFDHLEEIAAYKKSYDDGRRTAVQH